MVGFDIRKLKGPNGQDEYLINPIDSNAEWTNWHTRWMRSLHLDAEKRVLSCGWPKFMNLGEGQNEFLTMASDLEAACGESLIATDKQDGSTLIRFVQNGKVRFRTRGSNDILHCVNKAEIPLFIKQFPALADPNIGTGLSILFEWMSPSNIIILPIDKPTLILTGAVEYLTPGVVEDLSLLDNKFRLLKISELLQLQSQLNVPITQFKAIKNQNALLNLLYEQYTRSHFEGYVIRYHNEQRLVKLKTQSYVLMHRCLYGMSLRSLLLRWTDKKLADTLNPFLDVTKASLLAWMQQNIHQDVTHIKEGFLESINEAAAKLRDIRSFVQTMPAMPRVEAYKLISEKFDPHTTIAMKIYDNLKPKGTTLLNFIMHFASKYERRAVEE